MLFHVNCENYELIFDNKATSSKNYVVKEKGKLSEIEGNVNFKFWEGGSNHTPCNNINKFLTFKNNI